MRGVGGVRAGRPVDDVITCHLLPPAQALGRPRLPVVVGLGHRVVLVERHDLGRGMQRDLVVAVAAACGTGDELTDGVGVVEVGLLVGDLAVRLDVLERVVARRPQRCQVPEELVEPLRSGRRDVCSTVS